MNQSKFDPPFNCYVPTRQDIIEDLASDYANVAHRDEITLERFAAKVGRYLLAREFYVPDGTIVADQATLDEVIAWIDAHPMCAECCDDMPGTDVLEGHAVYCSEKCRDKGEFSPPDGEGYDWGCP